MTKKRILVIDNERKLCEMVKRRLELSERYEVTTAYSGTEGVEQAKASPFDLVITDVAMPGLDGHAVVDALKAWRPQLPVVLLSVYHDDERVVTPALLRKADGLLAKPIDTKRLYTTIEDVLTRTHLAQVRPRS